MGPKNKREELFVYEEFLILELHGEERLRCTRGCMVTDGKARACCQEVCFSVGEMTFYGLDMRWIYFVLFKWEAEALDYPSALSESRARVNSTAQGSKTVLAVKMRKKGTKNEKAHLNKTEKSRLLVSNGLLSDYYIIVFPLICLKAQKPKAHKSVLKL